MGRQGLLRAGSRIVSWNMQSNFVHGFETDKAEFIDVEGPKPLAE